MLEPTLLLDFVTAILIGTVIGVEREKRKREGGDQRGVGLRSFILLALLGAIAGSLVRGDAALYWLLPAALLAVAGLLIAGFLLDRRNGSEVPGMTTEMAALCVFLLGAMCSYDRRVLAVGLGVVLAAVLAYKQPLHGIVEKLGWDDVFAGLRLLLATFIVLPLLPDQTIDPWGAINPYRLWWLVLLIAGLSLVGYVATRWLGEERGAALTGVTGGLVSSTAVTLSFARQSRCSEGPQAIRMLACGVMLAWGVMFARVIVMIAVVNRDLLGELLWPLLAMGLMCVLLGGILYWRGRRDGPQAAGRPVALRNPFSLLSAISFGLLFAVVLLLVKLVQSYLPEQGQYVVALLAGLTDVDAITLSMAEYARAGDVHLAAGAILLAIASNTVCKCGMLLALGARGLRGVMVGATALLLAVGAVAFLL